MNRSERVDLISELRDQLAEMQYEDVELVMEEFGFGLPSADAWTNSRRSELGRLLRAGTDDDLVSLSSHFSASRVTEVRPGATVAGTIRVVHVLRRLHHAASAYMLGWLSMNF